MDVPPTAQEGASQISPPLFTGKYYGWWKNRMMDHIVGESVDLWNVILDGPTIPRILLMERLQVTKERRDWDAHDKVAIQNNANNVKAKKILFVE